jgi:hypothetical protein
MSWNWEERMPTPKKIPSKTPAAMQRSTPSTALKAGEAAASDGVPSVVKEVITAKAAEAAVVRAQKDPSVTKHIGIAVDRAIEQVISGLDPDYNVQSILQLRDTMLLQRLQLPAGFLKQTTSTGATLESLLGQTHTLTSSATLDSDGRNAKIALCFVHDKAGLTRRGIEVRLVDSTTNELLDRTLTDDGGLALLHVPTPDPGTSSAVPATGTIQVIGTPFTLPISIPVAVQHAVADLDVTTLPALPKGLDGKILPPPLGDDPLERLPADFTPALAEAIVRLRGATRDPILGNTDAAAAGADFRGRRTPVIKQMTVPRTGPDGRRYLVTMRQEWVFLGYTLGELKQVTSLDPGQVLRTVSSTVERTVSTTRRAVDEARSQALSMTQSMLSQLSSIDTLVHVATSSSVGTQVGAHAGLGFDDPVGGVIGGVVGGLVAGPIGAIVGGLFGGGAGVHAGTTTGTTVLSDTTTSTNVNTSLMVNSLLQHAQSTVNTAISTATQLSRDLQSQVSDTVDEISPLLSRVTNLVRWTMYENYAVISRVEDVVAVNPFPLNLSGDAPDRPVFSDEDIVELRRWFQPALLEPGLAPHFDTLRSAVAARLAGGLPITTVHLEIDYGTILIGGTLTLDLGETRRVVSLPPDRTSVRVSLPIPPTAPTDLDDLELTLNAVIPDVWLPILGDISDAIYGSGSVQVSKIRVWLNGSPARKPDFVASADAGLPTGGLVVSTQGRMVTAAVSLPTTARPVDTSQDPLFRHVNRNKSYYLSVLFEAGRRVPSLRVDTSQLKSLDPRVWDLPIYGFDGDQVLILESVDTSAAEGYPVTLVRDDGAATLVQLAAPGAYSEALQGLLQLDDAAGLLHPVLNPPKPILPPVALVDLDNKHLVPIQQDGALAAVSELNGHLPVP